MGRRQRYRGCQGRMKKVEAASEGGARRHAAIEGADDLAILIANILRTCAASSGLRENAFARGRPRLSRL
jgi:hypothetical protein